MIDAKASAEARSGKDRRVRAELVFEGFDLQPVEGWLEATAAAAGLTIERRGVEEITESYLDTEDGRLLRAGFCVRFTEGNEPAIATLERIAPGPSQGSGWRETVVPGTWPPLGEEGGLFGGRLRSLKGGQPLTRCIRIRSHQQWIALRGHDGAGCDIVIEEPIVPPGGTDADLHMGRVRLCPRPEGDASAVKLVEGLKATCPLRPCTRTRFQTVIATLGLGSPGPPELGPDRVEPSQTVGEAAYAVLRRHFRRMLKEEPGTRLGEDIEALHDMRVAIRRQRAALRLFREYLPPRVIRVDAELKRIASVLGRVRDLDVHLGTLEEWTAELDPQDRAALDTLRKRLIQKRNVARLQMLRALDAQRYQRLVARMKGLLRRGPSHRFTAGRASLLAKAPGLIAKRYDRVIKRGRKIDRKSSSRDYHRLRIRCKALRYALEFHSRVYGKPAQKVIRDLVALQDMLGEHQDAHVAATWLRGLISERCARLAAHSAFVAGRLAERYERRARRLRGKFPKRFEPITGRNWSRLHKIMQQQAVAGPVATLHQIPRQQAVRALPREKGRGASRKRNASLRQPGLAGGTGG